MDKPKEGIIEVFERFNKLINDLKLHDKYYEAEEVNLKLLLTFPVHFEQKIYAFREGRDLSRMTLEVLYVILKTYELVMLQRKSLKSNQGHVVDGTSALVANDNKTSKDELKAQTPVVQAIEQKNKEPRKKPKKVKKVKAYLELEAKYEALLKKQQGKAYIGEGKSWDETDDDDGCEEYGNYALMALEQGESSASKS
ncbi:hypothetical protein AgCh_024134 [Apium graveolens]